MLHTLYGRLVAGLLVILTLVGLLYMALLRFTVPMYLQEVQQKLNLDLARHVVAEEPPIHDGEVNQEALEESFHWLMVINPSIEIYLLDPGGRILGYSAPPEKVKLTHVDLGPIQRLLAGEGPLPILGDDPRHRGRAKAFSAAPVVSDDTLEGYLYVVLGGELHDSVATMVRGSYILKLGLGAVFAGLLFTFLAGLFIFHRTTRRLRRLTAALEEFEKSRFTAAPHLEEMYDPHSADELDRLGGTLDHMSRTLLEQLEALQRADSLRRDLVANVSHDLRTPLAALQGYLETLQLKESSLSESERRLYLQIATGHGERLGRLIDELFELAKLDACETPIHREPFAIDELVQDVVQKFELTAAQRSIRLRAESLGRLPMVSGDIGLIERVLENLLDNALRHTPEGGSVTLSHATNGPRVEVRVSDTGCGIPSADLPRVFERFYQRATDSDESSGGTGLGLAIAKKIVDLHGGRIRVDSRTGVGTSFCFDLAVQTAG